MKIKNILDTLSGEAPEIEVDSLRNEGVTESTYITISELMSLVGGKPSYIETNPAYQRQFIAKLPWKQSLISAILLGRDVGALYFHSQDRKFYDLVKETMIKDRRGVTVGFWEKHLRHVLDLMDGQQRTKTLFQFFTNKIRTGKRALFTKKNGDVVNVGEMTFSEMIKKFPEIKEYFSEYEINVVLFYGDAKDAWLYFIDLNSQHSMNGDEKRNAIKSEIRDVVDGLAKTHKLFSPRTGTLSEAADFPSGQYVDFANRRLGYQHFISMVFSYITCQETILSKRFPTKYHMTSTKALNRMYLSTYNTDVSDIVSKRVKDILDTICRMLDDGDPRQYRSDVAPKALLNMTILLDWMGRNNISIINYKTFTSWFFNYHNKLLKKSADGTHSTFWIESKSGQQLGDESSGLTYRLNRLKEPFDELLENNKLGEHNEYGIRVVSSKRSLTKREKSDKFYEQGGKSISGIEINLGKCHGAHINAHSLGGETDDNNVVLTTPDENRLKVAPLK